MPSIATILLFVLVTAGFVLIPGPSNFFVLGRGIAGGRRVGVAAAAGCAAADLVYVFLTVIGLSALLAASPVAVRTLHYAGAAYLAVLGARALMSSSRGLPAPPRATPGTRSSFRQAVVVELTNPKVALFFLALIPQFVQPGHGATWSQSLILGTLFVAVGFVSGSGYALASALIGRRLRRHPRVVRHQVRASGLVYLVLAGWAALSGAGTHSR